jgi:hypothetical protein
VGCIPWPLGLRGAVFAPSLWVHRGHWIPLYQILEALRLKVFLVTWIQRGGTDAVSE